MELVLYLVILLVISYSVTLYSTEIIRLDKIILYFLLRLSL